MSKIVKLVACSDTHSKHKQVKLPDEDFDIFIHAGDLTPRGNWYEFISVGHWFKAVLERCKHVIFIAGNHDWGFEFNNRTIVRDYFNDPRIHYLQDSGVELEGIKFWGSPWTKQFYNWAFMTDEEGLADQWAKIADDTQVLITHSPPMGILDFEEDQARLGSPTLLERVKALPKLQHHIFGHIHESGGKTEKVADIEGVLFHNVASLNGEYRYQNPAKVIEIEVQRERNL